MRGLRKTFPSSEKEHIKIGLFSQGGTVFTFVLFFLGGKKLIDLIHRGGGWGVAIKWNNGP